MSKYIDKDRVLEYIIFGVVGKEITCGELTRAIESIPTIEVDEDCISRCSSRKEMESESVDTTLCATRKCEWYNADEEVCESPNDMTAKQCDYDWKRNAPSVVPTARENRTTAEPQTYITEDRDTQILDAWQVHHRNITTVEDEPTTEQSSMVGEWIVYPLMDEGRVELECPICGDTFIRAVDYKPHFCENCGAKMKG